MRLLRHGEAVNVPEEIKPYLGTFYANYGSYKNSPFQVLYRNGHLALDVPDQLVFELKPPDKEGKWQFAITEEIAVSFKKDDRARSSRCPFIRPA